MSKSIEQLIIEQTANKFEEELKQRIWKSCGIPPAFLAEPQDFNLLPQALADRYDKYIKTKEIVTELNNKISENNTDKEKILNDIKEAISKLNETFEYDFKNQKHIIAVQYNKETGEITPVYGDHLVFGGVPVEIV